MFNQLVKPLFILTIGILALCLLVRLFAGEKKNGNAFQQTVVVLFLIYIGWVLCITLFPIPLTTNRASITGNINLIPIKSTLQRFSYSFTRHNTRTQFHFLQNTIGNIILFIPLGLLLPMISRINTFLKIVALSLLFSLGIEITQWMLRRVGIYRSVDIDDVILNVFGCIIGFCIFKIFYRNTKSDLNDIKTTPIY